MEFILVISISKLLLLLLWLFDLLIDLSLSDKTVTGDVDSDRLASLVVIDDVKEGFRERNF